MVPVPTRIGRYEIKGRIGGGGMGTLYLARDTNPTTDRLVAVKLLRASFESDEIRQRFAREAQALAELNHPNIVIIHDSGEYDDSPFIVMEYIRGETLAESIRRRAPMALGTKLRLLAELCAGLAHAHEAGIIHRDIKPANLMVDVHGRLKILDFGIARVVDPGATRVDALTRLNVQIGTPGYMSPEQIEGGEIDARSDLFSVGAVAYELISYHEAFPGATTRQIENRVLAEQPLPLVASIPGLDSEVAEIIGSALEKDLNRRCQHATTLARAFERVGARLQEEERLPRATPLPKGFERRSRHERAAQAAYERALASYREGADGFARRSAMEALAEYPQHPDARQLLGALGYLRDVEPWLTASAGVATPSAGMVTGSAGMRTPAAGKPSTGVSRIGMPSGIAAPTTAGPVAVAPQAAVTVPPPPVPDIDAPPDASAPTEMWPGPSAGLPGAGDQVWQEPAAPAFEATPTEDVAPTMLAPSPEPFAPPAPPPIETKTEPRPAGAARKPQQPRVDRKPGQGRTVRKAIRVVVILVGLVVAGIAGGMLAQRLWPPGAPSAPSTTAKPEGGTPVVSSATAPPPAATEYVLTVEPPTGGTIDGAGIRCGSLGTDCSVKQAADAQITLTATPDAGFTLGAFTGDCAPAGSTTMSAARRCGATFVQATAQWALTIAKPAGGTIVGPGIRCGVAGSACVSRHPQGFVVTLKYQAEKGYTFGAFTGDCAPAGKTVMNAARNCGATFTKDAPAVAAPAPVLTITRPHNGTILGNGINCGTSGADCSAAQANGASITLRTEPDQGFKFVAFTGDCDAAGVVVMSAARTCGATFAPVAAVPPAAGQEMNTNLPGTRAFVVRSADSVTVTFVSDSQYGGYTGVLKRRGAGEFAGDVQRPSCKSPSRVTLRVGTQGTLVGQFELRACEGRSTSRIGIVLSEKR